MELEIEKDYQEFVSAYIAENITGEIKDPKDIKKVWKWNYNHYFILLKYNP